MKKIVLLLIFVSSTMISFSQQYHIYLNYVSHNEENYTQYISNKDYYLSARNKLLQFGATVNSRGAKWSLASDHVVLDAVAKHDSGTVIVNTSGLNILKFLQDSLDVELDPHAHATTVSYADVAYKHKFLGLRPSNVVSGYLKDLPDDVGDWWFDYEEPTQSTIDPSYYWHPEILWGAATKGHENDPLYYGMWKPADTTDYVVHDPSKRMINYGGGCRIKISDTTTIAGVLSAVDKLVTQLETGVMPADGFYPVSMFMTEAFITESTGTNIAFLAELTDSLNVRIVAKDQMAWMHIEDIVETWKSDYESVGFWAACDSNKVLAVPEIGQPSDLGFELYPNPANEVVNVNAPAGGQYYSISVFDITGRLMIKTEDLYGNYQVNIDELASGLYILQISSDNHRVNRKVIKY